MEPVIEISIPPLQVHGALSGVRNAAECGAVTAEDKIVTLSTCTGNEATRFIVQGKLARTYIAKKK